MLAAGGGRRLTRDPSKVRPTAALCLLSGCLACTFSTAPYVCAFSTAACAFTTAARADNRHATRAIGRVQGERRRRRGGHPCRAAAGGNMLCLPHTLISSVMIRSSNAICAELLQPKFMVNMDVIYERQTMLHRACYWGHSSVVELLMEVHADTSIRNAEGQVRLSSSALLYARTATCHAHSASQTDHSERCWADGAADCGGAGPRRVLSAVERRRR